MIYIVTGTPGTGKTTFAKKFAKENNFKYIDGNVIIDENKLSEGLDKETNSLIIDEYEFSKACEGIIAEAIDKKSDIIIDSHLSHYISPDLVDKCFVTECDLGILKKRLEERDYSSKKISDNLEAEAFKVCRGESLENGHNVEVIMTSD